MKNKSVGLLIIGLAIVIAIIVLVFNLGVGNIISQPCSHGPSCSMYSSLKIQTYIGLAVALLVLIIGLFLFFSKPEEKVVVKQFKEKKKKANYEGLDKKEREVVKLLEKENNAVFQASLMEKLGIGKVGMTRLLDKLEAKQIIERKRRGMNNIIVLKV